MKIRNGFVSNSSSTSFCLYGVKVESPFDLAKTLLKNINLSELEDYSKIDVEEELVKYFSKMKISSVIWEGGNSLSEGLYVGSGLYSINETKDPLDSLSKIREKLKDIFPNEQPKFYFDVSE